MFRRFIQPIDHRVHAGLALLALVLTNILWGAATPIFKWALQDTPPFTFAFIRFAVAGWILFPYLFTKPIHLTFRQMTILCLGAFVGFTIRIGALVLGVTHMDSVSWTLLGTLSPVVLFFVSIVFLREQFHMRKLVGMSVALLGAVVVIMGPLWSTGQGLQSQELEGLFYLGVMIISTVIYTLLHRHVSHMIDPIQLLALSFIFAAATFFPPALLEWRSWSPQQLTMPGILGILYAILFASFIAYYCYIYGIARTAAQDIGIFSYISPVAALLVAVPLLHEEPTIWVLLGGVIIFSGIYIAERRLHVRVKKHDHVLHHRV